MLNSSGTVLYQWEPQELLSDPAIFNPTAWVSDSTGFTVTAINLMNAASDTLSVNVFGIPETPVIEHNATQLISSAIEGNQWYNSDGPIEGANAQIYEPLVSDYYHVVVTSAEGCESLPSETIWFSYVKAGQDGSPEGWSIYPNPFSKNLNITFTLSRRSSVSLSLSNVLGQKVRTIADRGFQQGSHTLVLSAEGLEKGLYFLRMEWEGEVSVMKVIVSE